MVTPTGSVGTIVGDRSSVFDRGVNPDHETNLWSRCPLWEHMCNPSIAIRQEENWSDFDVTDNWTVTNVTAGTAAVGTAESGVLELDSASTTVTQGVQVQADKRGFYLEAGKNLWFETAVKVVDTFDKVEFFVGLSIVDTTIIAASANSSTDHIGWQCVTDDGVLLFSAEKAGTGATKAAATIAEDTYIRLGFFVNGVTSIQQYIDGVAVGAAHATANISVLKLVPSFVCQTGGTNDPIMHVKPYTIFQLL